MLFIGNQNLLGLDQLVLITLLYWKRALFCRRLHDGLIGKLPFLSFVVSGTMKCCARPRESLSSHVWHQVETAGRPRMNHFCRPLCRDSWGSSVALWAQDATVRSLCRRASPSSSTLVR